MSERPETFDEIRQRLTDRARGLREAEAKIVEIAIAYALAWDGYHMEGIVAYRDELISEVHKLQRQAAESV